ncbi:MAG: hypothetical protein ACLUOI_19660 [Eisenbergiella sp.]
MENHASIIGLSALMTTTMQEMRHVIELARAEGLMPRSLSAARSLRRNMRTKSMRTVMLRDAADAVRLARRLLGIREGMGGTYGNE